MSTDPDQIRAQIAAVLSDLPDPAELERSAGSGDPGDSAAGPDIDGVAISLERAHDVLVRALESVDRGPVNGGLDSGPEG
jgi:hypothetical protein